MTATPNQTQRAKVKLEPAAVLGEGGKGLGQALRELARIKVRAPGRVYCMLIVARCWLCLFGGCFLPAFTYENQY